MQSKVDVQNVVKSSDAGDGMSCSKVATGHLAVLENPIGHFDITLPASGGCSQGKSGLSTVRTTSSTFTVDEANMRNKGSKGNKSKMNKNDAYQYTFIPPAVSEATLSAWAQEYASVQVSRSRNRRLGVFFSILVVSCVMWSGVLDSSDVLLSYSATS